jgi:hypothetical protein
MESLFTSGHAADFVLGVLALEGLWLAFAKRWSLAAIAALLGPAILIVLGLRAALVGADWWWIALPLVGSLPLHLHDLKTRL